LLDGTPHASFQLEGREAMKTRLAQAIISGVSLIEVLAVAAALVIVSASIRFVSDRGAPRKAVIPEETITNASLRDFHAPRNAFHTYEARRKK
jgi:hypothetical protein